MTQTTSKYEGGTGTGQSVQLDRHPRIEAYDDAGTDDGVRIVTLIRGFAFYDAAANVGDDPEGRFACHSRACDSVKDALDRVNNAEPCQCGRCLGNA